jgi:hypothetical protein
MTEEQYKKFVKRKIAMEDKIIRDKIRRSFADPLRKVENRYKPPKGKRTRKEWIAGKGLVEV